MPTCPTPDKDQHADRLSAVESAAKSIRKRGGYLRIYLCPCGSFHLTHKQRTELGR